MRPARATFVMTMAAAMLLGLAASHEALAGGGHGLRSGFHASVAGGGVHLSFGTGHHRHGHGPRLLTRRHLGPTRVLTRPHVAPRAFVFLPRLGGHRPWRHGHAWGRHGHLHHHGHGFGHLRHRGHGFGHRERFQTFYGPGPAHGPGPARRDRSGRRH